MGESRKKEQWFPKLDLCCGTKYGWQRRKAGKLDRVKRSGKKFFVWLRMQSTIYNGSTGTRGIVDLDGTFPHYKDCFDHQDDHPNGQCVGLVTITTKWRCFVKYWCAGTVSRFTCRTPLVPSKMEAFFPTAAAASSWLLLQPEQIDEAHIAEPVFCACFTAAFASQQRSLSSTKDKYRE